MPLDFMLQIALEWETRENPSGTPLAIRPFIKEFLHYFFFIHWELKHGWSAAMITEDLHSKGWKKKTHKKNPTYFPQLSFIITAMEGDENICKENSTEDRGWVFIHKELCQGHTVTHYTSTAGKKNALYSNQVGKLLGTSFPVILPSFLKAFPFREQRGPLQTEEIGLPQVLLQAWSLYEPHHQKRKELIISEATKTSQPTQLQSWILLYGS